MADAYCLWCGKAIKTDSSFFAMFYVDDCICAYCRQKMNGHLKTIRLSDMKVTGLYRYDSITREMIIRYKELYDEALYPVFLYPYIRQMRKKYRNSILVPVPSSEKANQERGFSTVREMFSLLELPIREIIIKKDDHAQKEVDFQERRQVGRHLKLLDPSCIRGRRVVIIDDVVTTGASLLACRDLLKDHASHIEGLAVAYNKRLAGKLAALGERISF